MSRITRRVFSTSALALCAAPVSFAFGTPYRVSTNREGIAMQGYDSHAYWTIGAPREGDAKFTVEWRGKPWHFATAEDAASFQENPIAFEPQFGAYCTRAMSLKKVVDADPEVWRIHGDKLYLFAKPVGGTFFDKGQDAMIAKAQTHWESLGQS